MLRQKEVLDRDETGMFFDCEDNNNNNNQHLLYLVLWTVPALMHQHPLVGEG